MKYTWEYFDWNDCLISTQNFAFDITKHEDLDEGKNSRNPRTQIGSSASERVAMDPEVWGSLQYHISLLEQIYLRLPLREQLQLRGVCKEWNAIASQRRCYTDVIRKPFFVVAVQDFSESYGNYAVVGILTLHVASGCWRWTRLKNPNYVHRKMAMPFSVEGIVFTACEEEGWRKFVDAYHHPLIHPGILIHEREFSGKACGMAVHAPHSFQFIVGHHGHGTMIFDSATRLWEERPSRLRYVSRVSTYRKACLHFGDEVFIWSKTEIIFVYSLKADVWSMLETPPLPEPEDGGALGAWDGRVFLFSSLSLWELVDRAKSTWRRFAHVPTDIHAWLVPPCFQDAHVPTDIHAWLVPDNHAWLVPTYFQDDYFQVRVYASFCQEHVLMHTLVCDTSAGAQEGIMTKRFVLFNLATKMWEKEEMCAVRPCSEKMNTGLWEGSVDCFTEDRQGIRPLYC